MTLSTLEERSPGGHWAIGDVDVCRTAWAQRAREGREERIVGPGQPRGAPIITMLRQAAQVQSRLGGANLKVRPLARTGRNWQQPAAAEEQGSCRALLHVSLVRSGVVAVRGPSARAAARRHKTPVARRLAQR